MRHLIYLFIVAAIFSSCQNQAGINTDMLTNRTTDFNFDWKFFWDKDSLPITVDSDDSDWRNLNLPHDWSVEASFDSTNGQGCTAYLPGGLGWYKKYFDIENFDPNKLYFVYFDGVYNNSKVWLNGKELGIHPYGYTPFYFDITQYLNENGKNNVITVNVDHSRYVDSRWYTGSGIYRNVSLISVDKLHVPIWGTFVTTPEVSKENASVNLEVSIRNAHLKDQQFTITTVIIDDKGGKVASVSDQQSLFKSESRIFTQKLNVTQPQLWDVDNPYMYSVYTSIEQNGQIIDQYYTPLGIRTIKFTTDKGFFLNGRNMKIKGVCLHHDGGLVGSAVPKGVWRRRFEKLKEAGVNAIRVSHNPASKEFLELCDEMGFLVQDEFFDEMDNPKDKRMNCWERHSDYVSRGYALHFQEWGERDLKTTILRGRNHPSIFQWSIGNEIEWTYPRYKNATGYFNMNWDGNYFWEKPPLGPLEIKERYEESLKDTEKWGEYVLAETAQKLAKWTKEMDTTRPVIANCILPSASHISGYTDALDIVGYSYRRIMYDYGHKNYPERPIMGTENVAQWHEWKAIEERPFIAGTFLWTGIDYMGEATDGWPRKGTGSGILDIAGFEKPSFHMMKSLWNEEPHVYIATQTPEKSVYVQDKESGKVIEKVPGNWKTQLWVWYNVNEHWNYPEEETIIVEVISNCPQVELFLNDKSIGLQNLADYEDRIYKWAVPYEAGTLLAKGIQEGAIVSTDQIVTASEPVGIELKLDKSTLEADAYDVAHLVAQLVDGNGNPVLTDDREIKFSIDGNANLLGVDNGKADNIQDFKSNKLVTRDGRALAILQSTQSAGKVSITVSSEGLKDAVIILNSK